MAKKTNNKLLVLLDMHAILHRAYHGLPDFSSSKGEPTGALYGLSMMILKVLEDLDPDYVVACYDLPGPTHRHESFEDYKAGRKETEEALVTQIARSRDVLDAFSIPHFECVGFEADDLLGTIAEELKSRKDVSIVIASGDMDTLQLVDDKKVQVFTLKKGIKDTVLYDEAAVRERFGFGPELLPDYKGLRGDPSDNIPGIRGIGEKTATTLLTSLGDLDAIYKALNKNEETLTALDGISPRIVGLLRDHEEEAYFSKMLATIRTDAPIDFQLPGNVWEETREYEVIRTLFSELEFHSLVDRLRRAYGEKAPDAQISLGLEGEVDEEKLCRAQIALWLLDSSNTSPSLEDILKYTKEQTLSSALEALEGELTEKELLRVYREIELPLVPVLDHMEEVGVKIDVQYLKELSKKYSQELKEYEKEIFVHAGEEFNINSPKQLGEVLYEKLQLRADSRISRTSTGSRSTKESELQKLRDKHPIIPAILEYRELQKLLSTYIDNLPGQVGEDGRLRAEFVQTGTTTGRLSSQNPNLQNIPIRTARGQVIRNAFIAEEGYKILALDYSQIELRIAAVLSGDEKLLDIFREGKDVHAAVAAQVFEVPEGEVTKAQRARAKTINFGILYGMGVVALQKNLETTRKEAKEFYESYFRTYPALTEWIEKTKREAARRGYTETLFGRRRYFSGINSKIPYIRAQAERMAVNAPIQGTQADVIKRAMVEVDEYLKQEKLADEVRLIMQVHDELVYEVSAKQVESASEKIREIMESIVPKEDTRNVVFRADAKVGENWGELRVV